MRQRRLPRLLPLLVAAIVLALPASAAAQTLVVDSLADTSGGGCTAAPADCTLRDALTLANGSAELDMIEFAVTGTIEPETQLPPVINPVDIDATTVSGYAGVPLIALEAKGEEAADHEALALIGSADGSSVAGLAIGGFQWAMQLGAPGGGMTVCANYIGVGLDGQTATPNVTGILISPGSTGNRIGAGCGALGSNLISGNSTYGVSDLGTETEISANGIGIDAEGDPLGNGPPLGSAAGILVASNAVKPFIGGVASPGPGEDAPNTIAFNHGPGILVENSASDVSIRRNSIYANSQGALSFGNGDGTVTTFVEQFAAGPSATLFAGPIGGAEPNAEYDIDVFASSQCDGSGHGPGQVYLGSGTVETDVTGSGHWEFNNGKPLAGIDVESLTATATSKATGATSQFSECGRTNPESSFLSTPPPLTNSGSAEFTFTGFDWGHIDHYICSFEEALFVTCPTPYELSGLGDGQHKLVMRAVDGEGFQNFPGAIYEWTSDATPPSSSIESGPTAETASHDATFAFSASDATSGVEAIECRLDAGAFEPCSSPKQVNGLGEGPHSFEVRGTDKAGNVEPSPATYSWKVSEKPPVGEEKKPPPAPENGESVAVAPAAGRVFVTRPGKGKTELKEGETIPVGSVVDATRGKVTLTSVNKAGETQTAVFFGGVFVVQQHDGSNLVVLELRGPVGPCKATRRGKGPGRLARAGRKSRHLWGSGHGKFRTEGNYGSASVRGTIWLVEDRCDGTFFKTRRGVVTIRDFTLGKTFALPKGQTYLAQP
jgi:CSLREA domain-containing protein